MHRVTKLIYLTLSNNNVSGYKNYNSPVSLFKIVCSTINFFLRTNPYMILAILMIAITPIQTYNQIEIFMADIIFINTANTKIKSAKLSNFEPNLLAVLLFLATSPSNTSDSPQRIYKTKNENDGKRKNNIIMLNTIRQLVIILAIFSFCNFLFIRSSPSVIRRINFKNYCQYIKFFSKFKKI